MKSEQPKHRRVRWVDIIKLMTNLSATLMLSPYKANVAASSPRIAGGKKARATQTPLTPCFLEISPDKSPLFDRRVILGLLPRDFIKGYYDATHIPKSQPEL
jgi:hypothetical protein